MTRNPEHTATDDPLIGKVASDRYRILAPIAKGGMGRIYKAEQIGLGRMVALKILDDRTTDPEGFRKRFTLEAATSAKLSHPNIVVVHDYGSFETDGYRRYFMAMELIDGPTLAALLKQHGGRLETGRAALIAREIARALRDAHRQGVVHRDLKPSNVMLVERQDGELVKVLDFGIAKVMQTTAGEVAGEQLTHEGILVGTPRYMAPEQLTGDEVDPRSDLYSLGVLLYQMISGRTPHAAKDHLQAVLAHIQAPVAELPDDVANDVPPALREVIRKCLQKSPPDRFPDATSFLRALDAASVGLSGWSGPGSSGELAMMGHSGAFGVSDDPSYQSSPSGMRAMGRMSAPTTAGPDAVTQVAPTALRAQPEAPPPQAGSRAAMVATVGLLVAAVLGGAAWALSRSATPEAPRSGGTAGRSEAVEPRGAELTTPTHVEAPEGDREPEPLAAPAPTRFRLTVASTPLGADVTEDGHVVGRTPLTIELDATALAAAPHAYRIELTGHAPYLFTQGPSTSDVEVMALLAQLPSSPPRGGHRGPRPSEPEHTIAPPPEDRMLKTSR